VERMRFKFDARCTDLAQKIDPNIAAVYLDEAREYSVERGADLPPEAGSIAYRLAIKRFDRQPIRTWRILQDIKNQIAGSDRYAIEIYPPESQVTDTANIYHLWVFEEGCGPKVGLLPPDAPPKKSR
jgi:hypothetical protein